jgi:hypothetical protein
VLRISRHIKIPQIIALCSIRAATALALGGRGSEQTASGFRDTTYAGNVWLHHFGAKVFAWERRTAPSSPSIRDARSILVLKADEIGDVMPATGVSEMRLALPAAGNAPAIHFKLCGGLSQSPHWMEARPGLLCPILPFEAVVA